MKIYHYKTEQSDYYFSNFKGILFKGKTRSEVIAQALNELKLLSGEFLTI